MLKHIIIISALMVCAGSSNACTRLFYFGKLTIKEKSMNTKICSKCKQEKEIIEFPKNKGKKCGYSSWCKECYRNIYNRTYRIIPNKYIHLNNGITKIIITSPKYGINECLIDTEDYKKVKNYNWVISKDRNSFYVVSSTYRKTKSQARMHRIIMNTPKGMHTDHINHNGLDNRKCNMRDCTNRQNQYNQKPNIGTSKHKGVTFNKLAKKFKAHIRCGTPSVQMFLGYWNTEEEAAKQYDCAARIIQGEFAFKK